MISDLVDYANADCKFVCYIDFFCFTASFCFKSSFEQQLYGSFLNSITHFDVLGFSKDLFGTVHGEFLLAEDFNASMGALLRFCLGVRIENSSLVSLASESPNFFDVPSNLPNSRNLLQTLKIENPTTSR